MFKAKKINKSYGTKVVLADVSFGLEKGQRAALVGSNGVGKTTLLKIVAGLEEADGGSVEIARGTCLGYLPQDTSLAGSETILHYLRKVSGIDALEKEMSELEQDASGIQSERLVSLREQYDHLDGYSFAHRAEVMMFGFGMENVGLDRPLSGLSSGQKSKVALIGILLSGVDLLLLDEPTNNLDLPALIWLEDFLQNSDAACLIVSHDRHFLDRVANRVMELDRDNHSLSISGGTYSDYLERQMKEKARLKEKYSEQQDEIERVTDQIREKKAKAARGSHWQGTDNDKFLRGMKRDQAANSARSAKVMEKRLEKMEKIERPKERESLSIPLSAKTVIGSSDITLSGVVAGYQDGFQLGPVEMSIGFGNRVGFLGLNGSGKSTILKTITGELEPLSGKISLGSGLRFGNMMQEHETLPRKETLLRFVKDRAGCRDQDVFSALVKFGFSEQEIRGKISDISPGSRARLLLATFALLSVNVLILDEPTNHLDAEAVDALEEVLADYQGTVILVSHDRDLLEKARIDFVYLLTDGKLTRISDYREYVALAEQKARKLLRLM